MSLWQYAIYGVGLSAIVVASPAGATEQFGFEISGDTFANPFTITNDSTGGEKVTRFQLDLSPIANLGFDVISEGDPGDIFGVNNGYPFTVISEGGTGFTGMDAIADGGTLLTAYFTDFSAGKGFQFRIDVDHDPGVSKVFGSDLIGALATIDFSSGVRLTGELQAVASDSSASALVVTGQTPIDPPTVTDPPVTPPTNAIPTPTALGAGLVVLGGLLAGRRRMRI